MKHWKMGLSLIGAVLLGSISLCAQEGDITEGVSATDREKIIAAAATLKAQVAPAKPRHILLFTKTGGFRHKSIPHGVLAFQEMGRATGAFTTEHTEDPAVFMPESIKRFDAIVMLNTTGEPFADDERKTAFHDFVRNGKGLVGIHAATDTFYKWPEFGLMMGGYFDGHPWHERVTLKVEDPDHATCRCFEGPSYSVTDEIYQFRPAPYSRERLRILLSLDPLNTNMEKKGMKRADNDYPVGWVQKYGEGKVFYCSLGHREEIYWNTVVLAHFLAGVQFAIGDLEADTTPSAKLDK